MMQDECSRFGLKPGIKDKTVIVQGFGNVGYNAAAFFIEKGLLYVCIQELCYTYVYIYKNRVATSVCKYNACA